MQRLERLLNLMAALLDASRPLTREQIRERVPGYGEEEAAFRRAFERDKDALRKMSIPITVEVLERDNPDSPVGYRIPRDRYELPDPGLEADELAALRLAASAVHLDGAGTAGREAMWKLGGRPPGSAPAVAQLPGSEHLTVLFAAIAERRTVRFGYQGATRTVDAWFLSFRKGWWYLLGHDHDRDDRRSFRLDRFDATPEMGEPARSQRPAGADLAQPQPWEMGEEEPVEAVLRVDADQAAWAVSQVGEGAIAEHHADGAVTLRVRVTSRANFRAFVLGLLDHAEVLGPPELRLDLVRWLEELAA